MLYTSCVSIFHTFDKILLFYHFEARALKPGMKLQGIDSHFCWRVFFGVFLFLQSPLILNFDQIGSFLLFVLLSSAHFQLPQTWYKVEDCNSLSAPRSIQFVFFLFISLLLFDDCYNFQESCKIIALVHIFLTYIVVTIYVFPNLRMQFECNFFERFLDL